MYNVYNCGDNNTKFLLKKYQHLDNISNISRIFLKYDNDTIFAKTYEQLTTDKSAKLSSKIYYYSSASPNLSNDDVTMGTAWIGWNCPTYDIVYEKVNDKIYAKKLDNRKISIEEYKEILINEIQKKLEIIYNQHNEIFFAYSKGIDSLTILSFILKNGWQNRTTLFRFNNLITNQKKINFEVEKKLGFKKIDQFNITIDDIVDTINVENFNHLRCYTTSACLKRYPNSPIIFGFHGNQTLIHKKIFLEQINEDVTKNGYTISCNNWKSDKKNRIPTSIANYRLCYQKPWKELDGLNGSKIYDPLGSETIFDKLRAISWYGVDPNLVSEARLCKTIISQNYVNLLEKYSQFENQDEGDVLSGDLLINLNLINEKVFEIKNDNRNHEEGLSWLVDQYKEAKNLGKIKLNVLMSYKNIKDLLQ